MGEEYREEPDASGDARGADRKYPALYSGATWGVGARSNGELEETRAVSPGCISRGSAVVVEEWHEVSSQRKGILMDLPVSIGSERNASQELGRPGKGMA